MHVASPCHERAWVKRDFVAYACALNRTLIFRICKAESRKSEPSLSCALGMKEPVIGSKTSREGK